MFTFIDNFVEKTVILELQWTHNLFMLILIHDMKSLSNVMFLCCFAGVMMPILEKRHMTCVYNWAHHRTLKIKRTGRFGWAAENCRSHIGKIEQEITERTHAIVRVVVSFYGEQLYKCSSFDTEITSKDVCNEKGSLTMRWNRNMNWSTKI